MAFFRPVLHRLEERLVLSSAVAPGAVHIPPALTAELHALHQSVEPQFSPDGPGVPVPHPPSRDPNANNVRKNQDTLSKDEINAFVYAVQQLKQTYEDGSSIDVYDEFVQLHQDAMQNHAIHDGTVFFPWHREFLDLFERYLQTIDPTVTIPYWDWTVDNQTTSSLWSDKFLGGDGDPTDNGIVKTGPFRQGQWTLVFDGPDLRRALGVAVASLPTADQEQTALAIEHYDTPPYDTGSDRATSFRNYMAGWNSPTLEPEEHNRVHNWVGGSMLTEASPNDPVFWLVHANLDRIWAAWQASHTDDYPVSGAPDGENLNDAMAYFGNTPASVLDHFALGYRYDTESSGGGSPAVIGPGPGSPESPLPPPRSTTHAPGGARGHSFHNHAAAGAAPVGTDLVAQFGTLVHFHGSGLEAGVAALGHGLLGAEASLGLHDGHWLSGLAASDFDNHGALAAAHAEGTAAVHLAMASGETVAMGGTFKPG
jgi:tyrosinase